MHSKLNPDEESDVVRELQTHFEDEIAELCDEGYSRTEALDIAKKQFGSAKEIGCEMYEAYSRGSWLQVILSALPHLLLALTFVLHLWDDISWLIAVFIMVISITTLGWRRGKPNWMYSWLGYYFMLLLAIAAVQL